MVLVGLVIEAIFFLILGLLFLLKPNWYLKLVKWQIERILKAKLVTTKETEKRIKLITLLLSLLFLAIGFFILYFYLILRKV